jgi:hypothetical protein
MGVYILEFRSNWRQYFLFLTNLFRIRLLYDAKEYDGALKECLHIMNQRNVYDAPHYSAMDQPLFDIFLYAAKMYVSEALDHWKLYWDSMLSLWFRQLI